jgi:hypothetical protein
MAVPIWLTRSIAAIGPVLLVVVAAVGLWLAAAVGLRDILVFAGYQIGFVAAPGWLLYRVLAPEDSLARTFVFGWALGYALEVSAYLAASTLGARGLFAFYPLLALPLVPIVVRRERARTHGLGASDIGPAWAAAGVGVASLIYLGLAYFARVPLPWDVGRVTYDADVPYSLSIAGEALHHWPMTDPNVFGLGIYYHVWAHLDFAATSHVTGLALPLVVFRLAILPLTLLCIAQLVIAGRVFTGRASVGALAGALLLLVGEVDVEPWYSFPFLGLFFLDIWLSPTFLLGFLFLIPAMTLIAERVRSEESLRAGWRRWILVAILLIACAGAKPPTLPVLGGGLVVVIAWKWLPRHRVDANALTALAGLVVVFALFYGLTYRHSSFGLGFHPFGSFGSMGWVSDLRLSVGDFAGWPLGVLIGTLALFGPQLGGLIAFFLLWRWRLEEGRVFLLGMLVAGLGPFFLLHQGGNGQVYFSHYGLVAGTILAAEGIVLLAARWPRASVLRAAAATVIATAVAVVLVVYAIVTQFSLPGPSPPVLGAHGVLGILVLVGIFLLMWRWSAPSGSRAPLLAVGFAGATGLVLLLWHLGWNPDLVHGGYELVAALMAMTVVALLISRGMRRRELLLTAIVVAATIGALDVPLDQGPNAIDRMRRGAAFSNAYDTGLNRGLYKGLAWIREHTSKDAVLAVNNYEERQGAYRNATYFYYGAFAERRVFLQGWLFTAASWNILGEDALQSRDVPFPERVRLNRAVFEHGDRKALRVLVQDYGVRYLVDDRLQGKATPALARLGRVAFENPAVTVYEVGPARARS